MIMSVLNWKCMDVHYKVASYVRLYILNQLVAKRISDQQIIMQQVQRYSKILFVYSYVHKNSCFVDCGFAFKCNVVCAVL